MKQESGFIALISSILISAALLAIVVSAGAAGFTARIGAARNEYKKISFSLAESCVQSALVRIAQNYAYVPPEVGETVSVGADTCSIVSVTTKSSDANGIGVRIVSSARYRDAYTVLHVDATIPNPATSHDSIRTGAWQEVSTP